MPRRTAAGGALPRATPACPTATAAVHARAACAARAPGGEPTCPSYPTHPRRGSDLRLPFECPADYVFYTPLFDMQPGLDYRVPGFLDDPRVRCSCCAHAGACWACWACWRMQGHLDTYPARANPTANLACARGVPSVTHCLTPTVRTANSPSRCQPRCAPPERSCKCWAAACPRPL